MSDLGRKVLSEIQRQNLRPHSIGYFLARRRLMRSLAVASIAFGAISVAFGWFAITDFTITGGKGIDEMPFDDVAVMLPVFAGVAFTLFAGSAAALAVRTGRGYLFGVWRWLAAAVVASIVLGVVLIAVDVGPGMHAFLSARVPAYKSYTYIPYAEWSRPERGMLGGEAVAATDKRLTLRDFKGKVWDIDISEASIAIDEQLVEEGDVAVRGMMIGPSAFKATSIEAFD
jgi:hypothetical protein